MDIKEIKDKEAIKNFLFEDVYLHLYEIGNLQEKLFAHIVWYGAYEGEKILALAMLYKSDKNVDPFLFLLENKNIEASKTLLKHIINILPEKFYSHISKGLADLLRDDFEISTPVIYNKMSLYGDILLEKSITYPEYTYTINSNDFETIEIFLRSINPVAFFVPAMLNTKQYRIIRKNSDLIAMAGVHFYSPELNIAVIGNVATAAEFRGQGYGGSVTASLCKAIYKQIKHIGLNVRFDNIPAIKAYEKMGFVYYNSHEEIHAIKK